jgi:hypothetical protein
LSSAAKLSQKVPTPTTARPLNVKKVRWLSQKGTLKEGDSSEEVVSDAFFGQQLIVLRILENVILEWIEIEKLRLVN